MAFIEGQGTGVHLHLDGDVYEAKLRAVPKLDVIWVSPTLFAADGKRLTLAEALHLLNESQR